MNITRTFSTNARLFQKLAAREEQNVCRLTKAHVIKSTRMPSGLVVVSLENNSPLSSVAVIFNAGCRHETTENEGIVHKLRNSLGIPSKNYTAATLSHETSLHGGLLECAANRDFLTYSVHCIRDNVFGAAESSLSELLCEPKFRDWDLEERIESMHIDRAMLKQNYAAYAIELLHHAAYRRGGLGRSLFSPGRCVSHHDQHMLYDYVGQRLTANNGALVGVGVDHEQLLEYAADRLPLKTADDVAGGASSSSTSSASAAKYFGGEERKERGGGLAVVALAYEGVGLKDAKAQAVQTVLCSLLGTGPRVKWCYGESRFAKAVYASCKSPIHVSSINLNYTDSGLFGAQFVVDAEHGGAAARAVIAEFRKLAAASPGGGGLQASELSAAHLRVKVAALEAAQNGRSLLNDLATQALASAGGAYLDVAEANKLVDAVTADDVIKLAKKAFSSKMSMSAVGNLSNTPYLDELIKS